ncbi:MAG: SCO family protein [Isosphaeraceae bacterium]|nr:SCO family protein [Isosphaeraceae bacterium]
MAWSSRGRLAASVCSAAVALSGGCGGDSDPVPRASSKSEVEEPKGEVVTKRFQLRGKVRKVDPASKEVTIAHEAMPGFMGAMTMPFEVDAPGALDDVRPGDQVEGSLRVEYKGKRLDSYRLENLEVTDPAPIEMKLEIGPGGPKLREKQPVLEPGAAVPDFTMTTQEGKTLRLEELRGSCVVMTFIYTRCPLPDFCPASDAAFAELAKQLGGVRERAERVRLLSVSFDPEHDTPEVLTRHARLRGAVPPLWTYAVASHDELRKIAEPLGLTYGPMKDEIVHNLSTAVIGPDGRLVRLFMGKAGKDWTTAQLVKEVVERLRESGK